MKEKPRLSLTHVLWGVVLTAGLYCVVADGVWNQMRFLKFLRDTASVPATIVALLIVLSMIGFARKEGGSVSAKQIVLWILAAPLVLYASYSMVYGVLLATPSDFTQAHSSILFALCFPAGFALSYFMLRLNSIPTKTE